MGETRGYNPDAEKAKITGDTGEFDFNEENFDDDDDDLGLPPESSAGSPPPDDDDDEARRLAAEQARREAIIRPEGRQIESAMNEVLELLANEPAETKTPPPPVETQKPEAQRLLESVVLEIGKQLQEEKFRNDYFKAFDDENLASSTPETQTQIQNLRTQLDQSEPKKPITETLNSFSTEVVAKALATGQIRPSEVREILRQNQGNAEILASSSIGRPETTLPILLKIDGDFPKKAIDKILGRNTDALKFVDADTAKKIIKLNPEHFGKAGRSAQADFINENPNAINEISKQDFNSVSTTLFQANELHKIADQVDDPETLLNKLDGRQQKLVKKDLELRQTMKDSIKLKEFLSANQDPSLDSQIIAQIKKNSDIKKQILDSLKQADPQKYESITKKMEILEKTAGMSTEELADLMKQGTINKQDLVGVFLETYGGNSAVVNARINPAEQLMEQRKKIAGMQ